MTINWRALPPLTALRALAATAEFRNFSQAARALNVTPAAVAQQVRSLEGVTGRSLVQRDGRGVSLTNEGEHLAEALAEGFAAMVRGVEAMQATEADRPVRISLTAGFAAQWLMPRLKDFWDRHPDIGLSILPDAKVVDLHRDQMDIAVRYGNGNWPGLEAHYLASARLVIVGAPLLLGGRPSPTMDEMRDMDWVLQRNWPEQDAYLRQLGLETSRLRRTDLGSEELVIAAAREGLGLAVESLALIEADVNDGRLQVVHESSELLPAYFVVNLPGPQRAAARTFLKWLKTQA